MFSDSETYKENRYKAIVENMIDGFAYYKIVFDENGTPIDFLYVDVNQNFEKLTGLNRENIIGKKLTEVIPDIEYMNPHWAEAAIKAALNGESMKFEICIKPSKRWFSCSVFGYEYGYFAEIFHDITDSKISSDKVKKTKEILNLAIEGSGDGVWDWDLNANKVTYSKVYKDILGYELDELPTSWHNWLTLLHTEDIEYTSKHMMDHLLGATSSFNIEYRFRCKNGSYKWLLSRGKVTKYTKNGMPTRVTGTHSDITERKIMESALKESEEKYKSIFNSVHDAIFIVDAKSGDIIEANPAACSLYQYSKEEIITKNRTDFVADTEKMFINIEHQVEHLSVCQKKKDGTVFPTDTRISEGTYNQRAVRIIVVRDMTNHKLVRELRKEIEKNLLAINESKIYESLRTEFFANISHELRTPLNVILGSIQLENLYLNSESIEHNLFKYKKYTKIIQQNCFRLLRLVNNLIDITKIDSGYLDLSLENKNIVSIVEDITLSVADYVENKGVDLIFDTDIEELFIAVDSDMIERIILNLLSNAVKFTKSEGCIYVTLSHHHNDVIISVKDTGTGIPENKLEKIFDRFIQVDKSLTRSNEGSGIGLALVKSLVELHGGSIKAFSKLGEGCEFIVTLPIKLASSSEFDFLPEENVSKNYVERINIEFSDIYS
ncbi:PAS domain S-box protein [Clostridium swellfunianum]|uniref:PAS domain S-box protein n=1 Tax=Clostridium swellfunianum TaxID=1367462 RepID=UPI00202DF3CA|nr:PAS domain S-box protein [Clostridium swellfunianum]MCM0649922.1 PAS domain S-box protein [Clostridium swellfunianum]